MDKEREIEEMCEIARKYSEDIANTPYYKGVKTDMEAIYEAGYRKADEVRKETAKEILQAVYNEWFKSETIDLFVKNLAKKYGIEVDE